MIGQESPSVAHIPRAPLMPYMRPGEIVTHAQFPALVSDVTLLNNRINSAAERDAKARWEHDKKVAVDKADEANFLLRKALAREPEPDRLTKPAIPPEPQPPYYTGDSWNNFVLHDLNGIATLPLGLVSSFVSQDLRSPEAKTLLKKGDLVTKIFDNTKSTLASKIESMDAFITDFNAQIDTIIANDNLVKDYLPLLENAKKQTKIWKIIASSARLLNGIKDGNYSEVGLRFHELQGIKMRVGDLLAVAAKGSVEKIECAPEYENTQVDGVTAMMLFNLSKNAIAYNKAYVRVVEKDGEITVENDAKFPIDTAHLFEPMSPGKDGHTGYGLFTVRNIYGRLVGKDVVCESGEGAEKTPFVRFSIKKSLPVSSESPLPQPAQ